MLYLKINRKIPIGILLFSQTWNMIKVYNEIYKSSLCLLMGINCIKIPGYPSRNRLDDDVVSWRATMLIKGERCASLVQYRNLSRRVNLLGIGCKEFPYTVSAWCST